MLVILGKVRSRRLPNCGNAIVVNFVFVHNNNNFDKRMLCLV